MGGVNLDDSKMAFLKDLVFEITSDMSIKDSREVVHGFVMAKSGQITGERLRAALKDVPFQDDLEFLDKDTDEGMALVDSIKYMCNSPSSIPVMKVICTDVIHPLICRIRVLEAALANAGKTEEEKH